MKHNIYCINCGEFIRERRISDTSDPINNNCPKCHTSFNLLVDEPGDEMASEVTIELINPPEAGKHDFPVLFCPFCGKDKILKPKEVYFKDEVINFFNCHNPECKRTFRIEIL